MNLQKATWHKPLSSGAVLCALLLSACSNDNNDGIIGTPEPTPVAMASFDITISNLTNAQPFSPVGTVLHKAGYQGFVVGEGAGLGLETLAEAGDNSELLSEAGDFTEVLESASGAGIIPPGANETISISVPESELSDLQFTALTMLVNTNDAFAGVNAGDISGLAVGEYLTFNSIAYDAGTEDDNEAAGTIPGPADGGEGFNAERNDVLNMVTMHSGVVSQDDGLATSILTQDHRFDNPVARIRIVRVE